MAANGYAERQVFMVAVSSPIDRQLSTLINVFFLNDLFSESELSCRANQQEKRRRQGRRSNGQPNNNNTRSIPTGLVVPVLVTIHSITKSHLQQTLD